MISAMDRAFVAALCGAWAGLQIDPEQAYFFESRLAPLARREGYDSAEAFVDALRGGGDERLGWAAVEAMAVCDTAFFRDRPVFDTLAGTVLPGLARERGAAPVRIWSVGCASGQEIYSLTMLLDESPTLAARVELFASDLSERSLEKARSGHYSQFEVQQGLPARTLVRCFDKRGDGFCLSPRIRQMVRWRRVNLMEDLTPLGVFDLVLCRNVLTQLTPPARVQAAASLRSALAPGGRLVLGVDEPPGGDFAPVAAEIGLYAAAPALRTAA